MILIEKIKQFLRFYFAKDMPRDKYNFKFRFQQALCYLDWYIEDDENRRKFLEKSD